MFIKFYIKPKLLNTFLKHTNEINTFKYINNDYLLYSYCDSNFLKLDILNLENR